MPLRYVPMSADDARRMREGEPDAYGNAPERQISDGSGVPCRHCLDYVEAGAPYLIFALRPFSSMQPYAETGPVFMHAEVCPAHDGKSLPPILVSRDNYLLRGYSDDERIVYGTGDVVARDDLETRAKELLARSDVAAVHVRSTRYNCYQCRIVGA
ncbi:MULTISPECIES: DUF1203 domain-containing protein [unclassified Ensifer]|uniref:DUF1203 domain-containing protein n=1 Tax=unclassified Ensifer TaxID=2633371 RepID=UPI000812FAF0|nr:MULTISPECIES: DUF1203 domain-containing protein [unclassified Ensifer]OCP01029.1 hypothetical protein BBX50_07655 [Ensifer sp. LC11]OCP01603.1 hypothetical protein BC374_07715 [Ensifer sp. LC13]OCP02151.1 hypothetical protein BC362_20615 [Ensifer sp. LC14]OCP30017.1 hypothetical protein BC364_06545 [Ensifer sp. LC499]